MINEFAHTGDLEVGPGVFISSSAMRFQFARSGGPGGQNVNKLNTKAEVWVRPESLLGMHPEAVGRLRALAGKAPPASHRTAAMVNVVLLLVLVAVSSTLQYVRQMPVSDTTATSAGAR